MITINKTHSKTDLTDMINILDLPIIFSHQDQKKDIQDKLLIYLKNTKINFDDNYYAIKTRDDLLSYLKNHNPKKILNIKEKSDVMKICKCILQYCKNDFDLTCCDYNNLKEIEDDMNYIKAYGDVPSVRRCCRLLKEDVKILETFKPLISPQVKKDLDEKHKVKKVYPYKLSIEYSTPENKIIVVFD